MNPELTAADHWIRIWNKTITIKLGFRNRYFLNINIDSNKDDVIRHAK